MRRLMVVAFLSSLFLISCSNEEVKEVESEEPVEEVEEFTSESFENSLTKNGYNIEKMNQSGNLEQGDLVGETIQKLDESGQSYEFLCSQPCYYIGISDVVIKYNSMETAQYIYSIKDEDNNAVEAASDTFIKEQAKKYSTMQSEKSGEAFENLEEANEEFKAKQEQEEIEKGIIKIGMTKTQVIERWGKPQDINRTITASGTDEQWVYSNYRYLYFEDGFLTTIQN